MQSRILQGLTALIFVLSATNSFASGLRYSIVGAGTLSKTDASNVPTTATVSGQTLSNISISAKSKLGVGGGLLIDSSFSPKMSGEFGVLYITRKSDTTVNATILAVPTTTVTNNSLNYIQIPAVLRFWMGSMFSLGAGGYYAQGMGSKFSSSGVTKSDYGAIGSVQFKLPMGNSASFLVDGRYNYGLKNVNNSSFSTMDLKYRDIQILAGVTFGAGK